MKDDLIALFRNIIYYAAYYLTPSGWAAGKVNKVLSSRLVCWHRSTRVMCAKKSGQSNLFLAHSLFMTCQGR